MTVDILEQKQEKQIDQPDRQGEDQRDFENEQPGTKSAEYDAEDGDCQKHGAEGQQNSRNRSHQVAQNDRLQLWAGILARLQPRVLFDHSLRHY